MKKLFPYLPCFLLASCSMNQEKNTSTSIQENSNWQELSCGLYLSPAGEIGFPTEPDLIGIPDSLINGERKICPNNFITTLSDTIPLKDVVDTNSFQSLGSNFFKDSQNVYSFYAVCNAGQFYLFGKDTATFKVLGNGYAQYQSTIYHHSIGKLDAHFPSFHVIHQKGHIAKDSIGYFAFGQRISKLALEQELGEQLKD